jgi:DNA repair exonuclease SbcCD ATPase subunit
MMKKINERVETHNTCVYIISHRKEISEYINGEIILLKKEKGNTSRVV